MANSMNNLAMISLEEGDLENAGKLVKEALEINQEIGYRQGEIFSLLILSDIAGLNSNKKEEEAFVQLASLQ